MFGNLSPEVVLSHSSFTLHFSQVIGALTKVGDGKVWYQSPRGFAGTQDAAPHAQPSVWPSSFGVDLRIFSSKELPGDTDAPGS